MNIWVIMILVMVASYIVQARLQNRFRKYSGIANSANLTGAEVAARMLRDNGVYDVKICSIPGELTDNYNPENKTLNLSEDVYSMRSIAAAAVAAHECGHALQHAQGYKPLVFRSALVPVVSFANKFVSWVLLAGIMLIQLTPALLWFGILLFAATTFFSFVTLPVEINASARAVSWLENSGIANYETRPMAQDALKWAAYTYVIAAIGSLATLIYYITISNNRR